LLLAKTVFLNKSARPYLAGGANGWQWRTGKKVLSWNGMGDDWANIKAAEVI